MYAIIERYNLKITKAYVDYMIAKDSLFKKYSKRECKNLFQGMNRKYKYRSVRLNLTLVY